MRFRTFFVLVVAIAGVFFGGALIFVALTAGTTNQIVTQAISAQTATSPSPTKVGRPKPTRTPTTPKVARPEPTQTPTVPQPAVVTDCEKLTDTDYYGNPFPADTKWLKVDSEFGLYVPLAIGRGILRIIRGNRMIVGVFYSSDVMDNHISRLGEWEPEEPGARLVFKLDKLQMGDGTAISSYQFELLACGDDWFARGEHLDLAPLIPTSTPEGNQEN